MNQLTTATPEIRAAATWWANCLRNRREQDAGDLQLNTILGFVQSVAPQCPPDVADRFEDSLRTTIVAFVKRSPEWAVLSTDYSPDRTISDAWVLAGVDAQFTALLPVKTTMWIKPGSVRVRCGYGAAEVTIYTGDAD